jgi:flagellar hook-associated protein 1
VRSTFFGIELGKRGLLTQRYGLDVTGQNITNASTVGYSRQTAKAVTTSPLWMPGVAPAGVAQQLGTGTTTLEVRRAENVLLAEQTRVNLSIQGRIDEFKSSYDQIESIFTLPSASGLDTLMTSFFASWQSLSGSPEEDANRTSVRDAADALCKEFKRIDATLEDYRKLIDESVGREVQRVNTILEQVGKLNNEIGRVTGIGGSPNDLLDARDNLLEELATIVPVQVKETANRSSIVTIDGRVVVQDDEVRPLATRRDWENGGLTDVVYSDRTEISVAPATGSLGAMMYTRDELIPAFLEELDTLANALVTQVNAVHTRTVAGVPTGYGLDGLTGRDFFQGNSAATIDLTTEVRDSTRAIQAALRPVAGDGGNALAIAQLRTSQPLGAGTMTFDAFYQSLMAELGAASDHMTSSQTTQTKLMQQLASIREQERGVSLDEEFINMIKYEQGYQAASRLVTAVDEGLDKLINGTGRVGL